MFQKRYVTFKLTILVWFLGFSLFSCNDQKIATSIEGMWSIDTICYKGANVKYCLNLNVINFDKKVCKLPIIRAGKCSDSLSTSVAMGNWEILKTDSVPLLMAITTGNKIFYGKHKIIFMKDPINKLLKMRIESKNLIVICRKGLFSYDSNVKLIDDLIRLSK